MNLRESIKKELRLITEQPQPMFHSWRYATDQSHNPCCSNGVPIGGPCGNQGAVVLFSSNVPGGARHPGPNGQAVNAVASTAVWNAWGAPNVGEHIKLTWNNISNFPGAQAQGGMCVEYLGATPNQPHPNGGCNSCTLVGGPTDCLSCNTGISPPCDTTPASSCAQQWFANPAPTWATSFMSSNDCNTYTWFANNLEQDAIDIMNDPTTPSPQPGPYNDWNDIKNAANASGLGQPEKGQFKRKMAKAKYSQCQIQACNC